MRAVLMILAMLPCLARAESQRVQLYAAPALIESGLIQHIRPRFSLKTQVGVDMVADPAQADLRLWQTGDPLFQGLDALWRLDLVTPHTGAERFAGWLTSQIGKRTIYGFAPDGVPLFTEPAAPKIEVTEQALSGDAIAGRAVSYDKCGRCHVTDAARRMVSIGSAPSFAVLRSLDDWDYRFSAFYVLKPHPAFTQVTDVTPPFPDDRPPAIAPIELTLDELDAIIAYTATLAAADLGNPLHRQ